MAGPAVRERVERLNQASARRVIDPDVDLQGRIGPGQLVADELLTLHGTAIRLDPERRRILSREEVASMFDAGMRFEAVLQMGFARQVASARTLTDPRVTYLLHEMGEETRHQRVFQRVISQIGPTAQDPLVGVPLLARLDRLATGWISNHPAVLYVLVLAGEEIPDLLQRLAAEHPDTDPFLAQVNRYHRAEEARHLSFARAMLPELWAESSRLERRVVRHVLAPVIAQMFDLLVHPGVYETVGLDGWATWRTVRATPHRIELRHRATRPVLAALLDAGVLAAGSVPRGWQELCGVDIRGVPRVGVPRPGPDRVGVDRVGVERPGT
jgi:hypothetical protein